MPDFADTYEDNDDIPVNPNEWSTEGVSFEPGEIDTDPVFYDRVQLSSGVFVDVYLEPGQVFDPAEIDFEGLRHSLGIDIEDRLGAEPVPANFDYDDPDVRGPFTRSGLMNFLRDTGLRLVGDAYYDDEHDEYWFHITGTE